MALALVLLGPMPEVETAADDDFEKQMVGTARHADTQAGIWGTAWAGYQAVAEYVDHCAPVRAKTDPVTARASRLLTSDAPTKTKHRAWSALIAT